MCNCRCSEAESAAILITGQDSSNQENGQIWKANGRVQLLSQAPEFRIRALAGLVPYAEAAKPPFWNALGEMEGCGAAKPVGNFGTRMPQKPRGISGHCQRPDRRNALRSTTSFRRRNCTYCVKLKNGHMTSRVGQPQGSEDPSLGLHILFPSESTYTAPLFSAVPYSLPVYRPKLPRFRSKAARAKLVVLK